MVRKPVIGARTLVLWLRTLPRAVQQRWTSGRTALAPAGLLALIAVAAVIGLFAPSPGATTQAKAATAPAKAVATVPPTYLTPLAALVAQGSLPRPTLSGDTGTQNVPPGTPPVPTAPTTKDVAARARTIAPFRGRPGTLTPAGIATLALERGCSSDNAVVATAVAIAESGGSPSAQGDIALMNATWDWSSGLWQIRGLRAERKTGAVRDSVANQAAAENSAAMYVISQHCTQWGPWTTFTRGTYKRFVPIADQAVRYVVTYYNQHGHRYPAVAAPTPTTVIPTPPASSSAAAKSSGAAASSHASSAGHPSGTPTGSGSKSVAAHPSSAHPSSAHPSSGAPSTHPSSSHPSSGSPSSTGPPSSGPPSSGPPSSGPPSSGPPSSGMSTSVVPTDLPLPTGLSLPTGLVVGS